MSTRSTVALTSLDHWVRERLPDETSARVFLVHTRGLFVGVMDSALKNLLDALLDHQPLGTPLAIQQAGATLNFWSPVFLQLKRSGVSGTDAMSCFTLFLNDHVTGANLRLFWTAFLGRTGGSEYMVRCSTQLIAGHNGLSGTRVLSLIGAFCGGTASGDFPTVPIRLSKEELYTALCALRTKLDPLQVRKFCRFFQGNFSGAGHQGTARFRNLCNAVSTCRFGQQDIIQLIANHGVITDGHLARVLLECDFEYCVDFLTTALPMGIALPGTVTNATSLIAWVVPQGNIAAVVDVFSAAHTARVPIGALARLFCHLQHMTAGDRVTRLREFIERAEVARKTHDVRGRDHTWAEVMDLIVTFVTDQRVTNGPAVAPAPVRVDVGTTYCTSERMTYFLKAHTYRFFDFTIVNRSRDDITLFPSGTGGPGMRALVTNVLGHADPSDAQGNTEMTISTVDHGGSSYEIGLVGRNGTNQVGLLHFMPFSGDAGAFWHKTLLSAIGRLF